MAGWLRRFDEPIPLPDSRKLRTLKEAITYLAKEIPKKEHGLKSVQAAAYCVIEAAENDGPMVFARMGVMKAIHRHRVEPETERKPHHWGKRKLKRDR
jgi:hypothetical protein